MIKLILHVHRKPGIDRAAFKRHYEASHVPLASSVMQHCTKYVRNFVADEPSRPMDFDVVTEFWFNLDGPWEEARHHLVDAAASDILERDELLFMDRVSMRIFTVEEYESDPVTLLGNAIAA